MRILPKATLLLAASVFLLVLGSAPARAVTVNFNGFFSFVGVNDLGLSLSSPVFGSATYDPVAPDVNELVYDFENPNFSFDLHIGDFHFLPDHDFQVLNAQADPFYEPFNPKLMFSNGLLTGFDFGVEFNYSLSENIPFEATPELAGRYLFSLLGNSFFFQDFLAPFDVDPILAVGELNLPVPEPGTLLLLGSGLAGLAALRRKRGK